VARPRRHRASGAEALTPREREIAALAAEGLGNVEIAERLFITRKTVEGHLRTVFRKLEIASRDEITEGLSP
jgi:DNA-binding CsgD family transcriptional regulator